MRKTIVSASMTAAFGAKTPLVVAPAVAGASRGLLVDYRPRAITTDAAPGGSPLNAAFHGARLLAPDHIESIMAPGHEALAAGRAGQFKFTNWLALCTMVHMGTGIEERGIVRGLMDLLRAAFDALQAVSDRLEVERLWYPGPLLDHEIAAIADLLFAYEKQLRVVCIREYTEVRAKAVAQVRSKGGVFIPKSQLQTIKIRELMA